MNSSKTFEYFFDFEELEPYLPEQVVSRARQNVRHDAIEPPANKSETVDRSVHEVHSSEEPEKESSYLNSSPDKVHVQRSVSRGLGRYVSVHALGQFVYCARAAVIAAEAGDSGDKEEMPVRLDYLPNYDLERIEERLSSEIRRLMLAIMVAAGMAMIAMKGVIEINRYWFYPAFIVCLIASACVLQAFQNIFVLSLRRQAAIRAEQLASTPTITTVRPISWWSMKNAGFETVTYEQPIRHPELPLEGNPWRVLERGSLRIPVIRSGAKKLGPKSGEVFAKHKIRLAAYGLLLESIGSAMPPFGIVLPARGVRGMAVPLDRELKSNARHAIARLATLLAHVRLGDADPKPPNKIERCLDCPYGLPHRIHTREIRQSQRDSKPLLLMKRIDGKIYHCECGDRYGAIPPHSKTLRLGLTGANQSL